MPLRLVDILARLGPELAVSAAEAALERAAHHIADNVRGVLLNSAGSDVFPGSECGKLADSISVSVAGSLAFVGSTDPVAVYQELGTSHLRPRPFLAPAASAAEPDVVLLVGNAASAAIAQSLTATV